MLTRNTTIAGNAQQDEKSDSNANQARTPSISLPKGGGAIRGIGEKFAANPVTGTGSMSVPIAISPGRAGFGPQLSLSYDSGAGNGPFGFGWHLSIPGITRKTDKGLPQYRDREESDVFLLSGAEDLVPLLTKVGEQWQRQPTTRTVDGVTYTIQQYRPRIEGLFSRIERWTAMQTDEIHWRSISKENVTTLYGLDNNSRIFDHTDPTDTTHPRRIFSWLICQSYDDKGNAIVYKYKEEDADDIDLSTANEQNRTPGSRATNRYLKHILYGNLTSRLTQPDLSKTGWMFEVVFDYAEHDAKNPKPNDTPVWLCRHDPFSSYRSGFEVRTYRLCQRVLMFHHFPDEVGVGQDCLVRSTDFVYQNIRNNPDDLKRGHPIASFIASISQNGYIRQADGSYLKESLPSLEFTYSQAIISQEVQEVDADSLENLPAGIDGRNYRWVDLDGEGVSGILTEQADSWYYKPNLGNGQFGPIEVVAHKPSLATVQGNQQLLSLAGDGYLDLVDFAEPMPGFFKRTQEQQWDTFTPFASLPMLDWNDANLRFVDLDGDGLADVLITEHEIFTWHQSLAEVGFGPANTVRKPFDEERGPQLVFADGTQSIYLADMSGDSLTDLVRVRNGEVCYWPNIGYGQFGSKVIMDNAPLFARPELFDEQRVRLADIDGSGTVDIIYLGQDAIQVYFNQSGNSLSDVSLLSPLPHLDKFSSVMTADILGNGTASLVWSSSLPGDARQSLRYIDLMGGQKPHLLLSVKNNLGAETTIHYASSTKFYLADKLAGQLWLTRLAFPVYVVERVETSDRISGNRFISRYAYHHGYFDGFEREFRGFGMVEQWDTQELASLTASGALSQNTDATNIDSSSYVPPVLTRSWFHTGVFIDNSHISRLYEEEYYHESDPDKGVAGLSDTQLEAMLLDDSILPTTIFLSDETRTAYDISGDEAQEACRALKGTLLRQEIYALDGTDAQDHPYSVSEHNYTIELLQPQSVNRHAVFFTHDHETLDFHYERALYTVNTQQLADPRVSHTMTLAVDYFGNALQTVAIAYGRRYDDPDPLLTNDDRTHQKRLLLTYSENQYSNSIEQDDAYRPPLPSESRTYELLNIAPDANVQQVTNLLRFDELASKVQAASDGQHDLPFEDIDATGAKTNAPYRRLLAQSRTLYRRDDLSGSLPPGQLQPMALPFESYRLAFTPGLLTQVYQRQGANGKEALLPDPVGVLGDECHYVRSNEMKASGSFPASDADECWWQPSGQVFYSPGSNDTTQQEQAYASQHFFLPLRFRNPFGQTTTITYEQPYDLLPMETLDPLANRITSGERDKNGTLTRKGNDYRVLQPQLVMDANRNRSAVAFNALGMVVGTAVMGKPEEQLGDTLDGFIADLDDKTVSDHLQNPLTAPESVLQHATTRLIYDLFVYVNTQNSPQPQPVVVYTLARETHDAALAQGQQTKIQHSFSYSDGFGREIQKKLQAEPGPLADGAAVTSPRWVGSGWTIFNNKGKPVRQYEPFFSATHHFEFAVKVGVSPILFYDPIERVVATLHPNHTYEKVVFDPWKQATWDVNDTMLLNPKTDADVSDYFQRLPDDDYLPTWYDQRKDGTFTTSGVQEQAATQKASVHANTPTLAYFDTLGRTFLTIAHNHFMRNNAAIDEHYESRVTFDIQGHQRDLSDARNRIIMRYDYDMPGTQIHQASMEAGERWLLNDVAGKPVRTWDSRGHTLRTVYDALRRPLATHLSINNGAEVMIGRIVYGESQPTPETTNLRGKTYQIFDGAGVVTSDLYDFKGNLLQANRQLATEYKQVLNWSQAVPLEAQTYASSTTYDALNRPVTQTLPDNSVLRHLYNEANLLEQVEANVRGDANVTQFVTNIDYNAKGQRTLIEYGNGASTQYAYDAQTFRLTHFFTSRGAGFPNDSSNPAIPTNPPTGVQNLSYIYDPMGNITHIQDDAQQTIYFRNRQVEPGNDYTYDAIYRLIEANGREHLGQLADNGSSVPVPPDFNDIPRTGLVQPGDGNAMGRYLQQYSYDEVGNILQMLHSGTDPAQPGWTRTCTYNEASLLEAGKVNNRLTSTQVGNGPSQPYTYDVHGNMITMPHLPLMQWDYKDQLQATTEQSVNNGGTPEITYYVYDGSGQRIRKVTERQAAASQTPTRLKERIYLGGFEVYREYGGDGSTISLERETLHIMDDKQRVALIETRTQGDDNSPQQLTRYQFSNHLGTACLELDDKSQIITYEEYYPFGSTSYQAMRSQTETPKRYRYTAKERDEENDLYYHGARYYACWLGRWTSCDPKGVQHDSNLFTYAKDNPINLLDPNGAEPSGWWKTKEVAIGIGEGLFDVGKGLIKTSVNPVGSVIDIGHAMVQAYKQEGGGFSGVLMAANVVNPAYQAMVAGYETYQAVEKGNYREAGRQGVNTAVGVVGTVGVALGGAGLATRALGLGTAVEGASVLSETGNVARLGEATDAISTPKSSPASVSIEPPPSTPIPAEPPSASVPAASTPPTSATPANPLAGASEGEIDAAVNAPGRSDVMVQAPAKNLTTKVKPYGEGQYTEFKFDSKTSVPGAKGDVRTTLKVHDPDPTAPPGSNSQSNTTLGIEQGKGNRRVVPDTSSTWGGRWIDKATATPDDWNASHIPIFQIHF